MKKMFLTCALSAVVLSSGAQITERRMATLVDEDVTRVFYGADAPKQAYEAAKDGATIILSEGEFNTLSIEGKSVKLYGAGMNDDEESGLSKTKMSLYVRPGKYYDEYGKEYYALPEDMHVEGIHSPSCRIYDESRGLTLKGLIMTKCQIDGSSTDTRMEVGATVKGMVISQCKVQDVHFGKTENDVVFRNCHIKCVEGNKDFKSAIIIDHCILERTYSSTVAYYTNNILLSDRIPDDATAYNNIVIQNSGLSQNATGDGNWFGVAVNGIFAEEGEDGTYAPGKKFTLKFPKTYVGTDGTEVGINGGVTPWNPIPSLPRIVSSKIDNRADTEGKINVNIKVEAQNRP